MRIRAVADVMSAVMCLYVAAGLVYWIIGRLVVGLPAMTLIADSAFKTALIALIVVSLGRYFGTPLDEDGPETDPEPATPTITDEPGSDSREISSSAILSEHIVSEHCVGDRIRRVYGIPVSGGYVRIDTQFKE